MRSQDPGHSRSLKSSDDNDKPEAIERYNEGWRAGKPVEDPEKLKRWGYISVQPSEYLIFIRNGKIDQKRSGQGASVFKWPWDSVAVVPTKAALITLATNHCGGAAKPTIG